MAIESNDHASSTLFDATDDANCNMLWRGQEAQPL